MRYTPLTTAEKARHRVELLESAIVHSHGYGITNLGRLQLEVKLSYWEDKLRKENWKASACLGAS